MGDILAGSLAFKVSEPVRMSPGLLIGREGDIFAGSLGFKVIEPARMFPARPIRSHENFVYIGHHKHTAKATYEGSP